MRFLEIGLMDGSAVLGLMPLLEKTLVTTNPGYKEYVESTSVVAPWFPRRKHRGEE